MPRATLPVPGNFSGKQDSNSNSLMQAEIVAGAVAACGVELSADSESQWILVSVVTQKKKRDPKS